MIRVLWRDGLKKFMILGAPSLFDFTSGLGVWAIQDESKRGQFEWMADGTRIRLTCLFIENWLYNVFD